MTQFFMNTKGQLSLEHCVHVSRIDRYMYESSATFTPKWIGMSTLMAHVLTLCLLDQINHDDSK